MKKNLFMFVCMIVFTIVALGPNPEGKPIISNSPLEITFL